MTMIVDNNLVYIWKTIIYILYENDCMTTILYIICMTMIVDKDLVYMLIAILYIFYDHNIMY